MSINHILGKIKSTVEPFYIPLLIVVIASIFFAFGRLSAITEKQTPIKIQYAGGENTGSAIGATLVQDALGNPATQTIGAPVSPTDGAVIGSKSGKKYYFPWCSTVKRIKPENQVHFASIAAAKSAGFTAGGNCKGLQ